MKRWRWRGRGPSETGEQAIDIACRDVVEIITDYLEGLLDPATARAVEAHLLLCDGCDEYLAQMRTTIQLVGRVPPHTLSTEAKTELMAAFRNFTTAPPA